MSRTLKFIKKNSKFMIFNQFQLLVESRLKKCIKTCITNIFFLSLARLCEIT